jgi:transposase
MSATAVPARARRYTTATMQEARTMFAGGWSAWKIGQILGVHTTTVRSWVDPEYAARRSKDIAAATRRARYGVEPIRLGHPNMVEETVRVRAVDLRRHTGISFEAIARVVEFDHGIKWTSENVRYMCAKAGVS